MGSGVTVCVKCGEIGPADAVRCGKCGGEAEAVQAWRIPESNVFDPFNFNDRYSGFKVTEEDLRAAEEAYAQNRDDFINTIFGSGARARRDTPPGERVPAIGGPFHQQRIEVQGLVIAVEVEDGLREVGVQEDFDNHIWWDERSVVHTYRLMTDEQTGQKCYVHTGSAKKRLTRPKQVRLTTHELESHGSGG
jgi:hypothetical protein